MTSDSHGRWADELDLAFRLGRAADVISRSQFTPADRRVRPGQPWKAAAEIAEDVESRMVAILREQAPGDHIVSAKAGESSGTTTRRWLILGIDDELNFTLGRPGWGTSIACEVDGVVVVGLLSCAMRGRTAWATQGGGAWSAGYDPTGSVERSAATPLHCSDTPALVDAAVSVLPWDGVLVGWRNDVCRRFVLPFEMRTHGAVNDAVATAAGELDALILTDAPVPTLAAISLVITEAGGRCGDVWGRPALATNTLVCANEILLEPVLEVLADLRPDEPDKPQLAILLDEPIGTEQQQQLDPWLRFGFRRMPSMSSRVEVLNATPEIRNIIDDRFAKLAPFVGVTNDGVVRTGLRRLDDAPKVSTQPIADAALEFVAALNPSERNRVEYPLDATEWRTWLNVHMAHNRHGLLLDGIPIASRQLALGIIEATLSARGYDQARTIMRINQLLAEISGDHEAFGEWPYFFSIFGEPGSDAPWGWQIDGHHLCINALLLDGRLAMTPVFMGAEPRNIRGGALAGTFLFGPEESSGLSLLRSLDDRQRSRTILEGSIHKDHISPLLQNRFDGRMQAGAFHDNAVLPYQGISGSELTDAQRRLLVDVAASYVGWAGDGHADVKMSEVVAHLDETWFSWYGGFDDVTPFYYRLHSPVVLIEFDHHPGTVFKSPTPTRYHVHTVVRTPNGGDYGADLLAQHHERFDHRHGGHRPRDQTR